MSDISFADVVHQSISFSTIDPAEKLVLDLIDSRWFQRLRDISQTANTRLVYMFSEHSRFGHCLGVAYLAKLVLTKLADRHPRDVELWRPAILAAALLHDIGHLAPGSHTAFKTWFPGQPDCHEALAHVVINEDTQIRSLLDNYSTDLRQKVLDILDEAEHVPAWTWQVISGGGWNVDRGNWSAVDSILAGVSYGMYNIPALVESILITEDKRLALMENRLDAMMHFMVSRHAMYRQIYQHRVLLAADMLNKAVARRARDLGDALEFADDVMKAALSASNPTQLSLDVMFQMRESWWRYHLMRWTRSADPILSDLSDRILSRRLLKTIRIDERHNQDLSNKSVEACLEKLGFDPRYYLHEISTADVHAGDTRQSIMVQLDTREISTLSETDPLFQAMVSVTKFSKRSWLALPKEAKLELRRLR
jgi:HD superfamily phosphohydrolase